VDVVNLLVFVNARSRDSSRSLKIRYIYIHYIYISSRTHCSEFMHGSSYQNIQPAGTAGCMSAAQGTQL